MGRIADFNMIVEFTFRTQGSHNETELSQELVDRLSKHDIAVPSHEDDDRNVQFVLCYYKRARAPSSRRSGQEHRISRDENATVADWFLKSLQGGNPDLEYEGLPVIFVGAFLSVLNAVLGLT
jgi:hypothetical protein